MKGAVLALPLLLLACADPVTQTRTVDDRARVRLQGATPGTTLYIDGESMGDAAAYAGKPGVIRVASGTHLFEVKRGETVLLSEKVFLGGGEQRTVVVAAPAGR